MTFPFHRLFITICYELAIDFNHYLRLYFFSYLMKFAVNFLTAYLTNQNI